MTPFTYNTANTLPDYCVCHQTYTGESCGATFHIKPKSYENCQYQPNNRHEVRKMNALLRKGFTHQQIIKIMDNNHE